MIVVGGDGGLSGDAAGWEDGPLMPADTGVTSSPWRRERGPPLHAVPGQRQDHPGVAVQVRDDDEAVGAAPQAGDDQEQPPPQAVAPDLEQPTTLPGRV